jgi:hypothetical protein
MKGHTDTDGYTDKEQGDIISLFYLFKIGKVGYKSSLKLGLALNASVYGSLAHWKRKYYAICKGCNNRSVIAPLLSRALSIASSINIYKKSSELVLLAVSARHRRECLIAVLWTEEIDTG